MLGGIRFIIPVIKAAKDLGLYVITCDNIPQNIAHKYSDEYHNISIVDKKGVLDLAKKIDIDGIMSFAVDPGVLTTSYVAEKLGLPGCPYNSVKILQNKDLFRNFLKKNNFTVPTAKGFSKEFISKRDLSEFNFPVIVKPVDSAGSKGVCKVNKRDELLPAIKNAISNSITQSYIIEDFIYQRGFSSDSDCFSVDGKIKFFSFSSQHFDKNAKNPYTPSAFSWPSSISDKNIETLKLELQRLVTLLNLGTSLYNIEVREGIDGKAYIMEVSPRGGGNRLSEMMKYATGTDLIKNSIKAAVGINPLDVLQKPYIGNWAEIILHSNRSGIFERIDIDIDKDCIVEVDMWVNKGDLVNKFNTPNDTIGTLIINFGSVDHLNKMMNDQSSWIKVIVK